MKLIIRRKDSVTSILLFLFNVFLLPGGRSSIGLSSVLRILESFGKNETATRMGLSRAIQNHLLIKAKEQGEILYQLSPAGESMLDLWWQTMRDFQARIGLQQQPWDGNWHLVLFSIPGVKRAAKDEFTDILERLGFGILNKGVWISPYDHSQHIASKAAELKICRDMHLFCARPEGVQSDAAIVDSVWNMKELKQSYKKLSGKLDKALTQWEDLTAGEILKLLHGLGLEFMEVIAGDPQLPLQILPEKWQGGDCAIKFQALRGRLLPIANEYVNSILGSK